MTVFYTFERLIYIAKHNGDAIYGAINGTVKSHHVIGFNNDGNAIYGGVNGAVKTHKVIGFDSDLRAIYANDAEYASKANQTTSN